MSDVGRERDREQDRIKKFVYMKSRPREMEYNRNGATLRWAMRTGLGPHEVLSELRERIAKQTGEIRRECRSGDSLDGKVRCTVGADECYNRNKNGRNYNSNTRFTRSCQ